MDWKLHNLSGRGEVPPALTGKYRGAVAICGSAACLWDDLTRLTNICGGRVIQNGGDSTVFNTNFDIIAVNDAASFIVSPRFGHIVSGHPELLDSFRTIAECRNGSRHILTHSIETDHADHRWGLYHAGGTSSLDAVLIATMLGYDKIILCGVPLDTTGHFYDPTVTTKQFVSLDIKFSWELLEKTGIANNVRSMSGRTMDWYGKPDLDWTEEIRNAE